MVAASFDPATGEACLRQISVQNSLNSHIGPVTTYDHNSHVIETLRVKPAPSGADFIIAGAHETNPERGDFVAILYSGKIDRCGIVARALSGDEMAQIAQGTVPSDPLAYWDTKSGYDDRGIGTTITDTGPDGLHAQGVNRPIRAMTGWNWKGREDSFRLDPSQYGGISFHDDALTDCNWETSLTWTPPSSLKSGVYALRVSAGERVDRLPVIIRPDKPRAKIAVQMSTFTYLAYANERLSFDAQIAQAIVGHTPVISADDIEYNKLEEFGLSTYDHHSDGAGVCYSSWKRPIINLRPGYRMAGMTFPWALPADLSLLWWLEHAGYDYDVITDHDVHREGKDALAPYKTVINVTHPEYYSEGMLDATEEYLMGGGRMMYLGGNGYYWVTNACPDDPACIEARKLDVGSRAWQAEPGEGYLATSGERSGLWRSRGRAPQKLVGHGFTAEGMDRSEPFERMPDSFHKRVAWISDGIGDEELIGDFGLALGGAAGVELSHTIGFDCAWYGWAQVKQEGVEIHANSTLNLPEGYYDRRREISQHDLLAANILEHPGRAVSYDRFGTWQNDGMVALADQYGLHKMATAMHSRPGRIASFYLSGYRSAKVARSWSASELEFLQCAVDQLSAAMRLSAVEVSEGGRPDSVSIFVNEDGVGILGLQNLQAQLSDLWPDWTGDRLPRHLRELIGEPGEHILVDRNLVVRCEAAVGLNEMGLWKFTLQPITKFDLLTNREREVAHILAGGKSYKETARLLGVAPATIRNQTQSIYAKLDVGNRANLAAVVKGSIR